MACLGTFMWAVLWVVIHDEMCDLSCPCDIHYK